MPIEEELKKIIIDQLGVDSSELIPDAKFTDDLGADSLDAVELIMSIEEKFKIEISDKDAEKLAAVGDIVKYLKKRIGDNKSS